MASNEASDPLGGAPRVSDKGTANPNSLPPNDEDDELDLGTSSTDTRTIQKSGRTGKRFDNLNQHVVRHKKTPHIYRIGIKLPKEKLQQFPPYQGKIRETIHLWTTGAFLTLKVDPAKLEALIRPGDNEGKLPWDIVVPPLPSTLPVVPGDAASVTATTPGLFSANQSIYSAVDTGPNTPAADSLAGTSRPNTRAKAAEQEALTIATGSFDDHYSASGVPHSAYEDLPLHLRITTDPGMAPVKDTSGVDKNIRDVIQHLTDIQMKTQGYIPATQELLVDRLTDLTASLAELKRLTSPVESPSNYIHQIAIAPEIVDYVDDGRNPDIFTRDFVENVQRGNSVINGKQQAFRDFTEVFAQQLKEGIPGISGQVDRVLQNAGLHGQNESKTNGADGVGKHVDDNRDKPANS